MRTKLVAGNWKMHGSLATNLGLLHAVRDGANGRAEVAVCVPYPYLAQARAVLDGGSVAWGAQDVSEHAQGAWTGEVSGAMLAAAERGLLLLIDGFIVTSALLVAAAIAPNIRDYCVYCHRSAEPGHLAQLRALNAEPLLDLGLRLGEGTGAALAWPLVRAAAAFLNEMASFAAAGVSR